MYSNEQKGNNPDYVLAVSQALAGRQEGRVGSFYLKKRIVIWFCHVQESPKRNNPK